MKMNYWVSSKRGDILAVIPVEHIDEVKALVNANPGATIKAHASIDNPCAKHPAYEADNCPGCGTALGPI